MSVHRFTMIKVLATLGGGAVATMLAPAALHAQAPVQLVCNDGSTQPGPTRAACKDHKGVDWGTTKAWSKMRAGHFAAADTVVCSDGQTAPAAARACASQGGVDSVSTIAALKRRSQAARFERMEQGKANPPPDTGMGYRSANPDTESQPGKDTARSDSTK